MSADVDGSFAGFFAAGGAPLAGGGGVLAALPPGAASVCALFFFRAMASMRAGRCSNVGLAWTSCQKFIMALARRELVDRPRTLSPVTLHLSPFPLPLPLSTLRHPSCNTTPLQHWRHLLPAVAIVPRCAPYTS
jgi:hypothetical protein